VGNRDVAAYLLVQFLHGGTRLATGRHRAPNHHGRMAYLAVPS
jgi:hypothetical protein